MRYSDYVKLDNRTTHCAGIVNAFVLGVFLLDVSKSVQL